MRLSSALRIVVTCSGGREPLGVAPASDWNQFWLDLQELRADSFEAFMEDRQKRLLALIEQATGKAAYTGNVQEEGEDVEADEDTVEAEGTIAAA
jgi:hypothetical protein